MPYAKGTAQADIELSVPPEHVWRLLTSDEGFSAWMGDGSTIEPWPGGTVSTDDPVSGVPKHGTVTHLEKGSSIGWDWIDESNESGDTSHVHIRVSPIPDGTLIRVTETAPGSLQAQASIATTWQWRLAMTAVALPLAVVSTRA